jgi:hypothetical protein
LRRTTNTFAEDVGEKVEDSLVVYDRENDDIVSDFLFLL